jgi:hypothetical protein
MARVVIGGEIPDLEDGWKYCYTPEAIMLEPWASAGTTAGFHSNIREAVGHAFYMSDPATVEGMYAGFTLPGTVLYYVQNSSTLAMFPTTHKVGGRLYTDRMNPYASGYLGSQHYYPVEHFDPDSTIDPTKVQYNPNASYQTSNSGGNGFQFYVPQGPITCYFWDKSSRQEWASGCMGLVSRGPEYGSGSHLILDIIGMDGSTFRSFTLNFWGGTAGVPGPGVEQNIDNGTFITTWIEPESYDYFSDFGDNFPSGGTVKFQYLGRCAGFRVRKDCSYTDEAEFLYTNPRDFWMSGWGKRTPEIPPLRWNQRNDGDGIVDFSSRISPDGAEITSAEDSSSRFALGQNSYE